MGSYRRVEGMQRGASSMGIGDWGQSGVRGSRAAVALLALRRMNQRPLQHILSSICHQIPADGVR